MLLSEDVWDQKNLSNGMKLNIEVKGGDQRVK